MVQYFRRHENDGLGFGPGNTTFTAVSERGTSKTPRGVLVSVVDGAEIPNFANDIRGRQVVSAQYKDLHLGDDDPSDTPVPEPTELFSQSPAKIIDAFADPSMRFVAPTVMGMAYNHAKKWGTPVASSSLSGDSAHLAQQMGKKGLIKGSPDNPDMAVTNNITSSIPVMIFPGDLENAVPVDERDLAAGRATARALTGRRPRQAPKATRGQSQFEQLRMDI